MLKECYKDQEIKFEWLNKGVKKATMKLSDMKFYTCYYAVAQATGEFIVVDGEPFIKWSDLEDNYELTQSNINSLVHVELVPKLNNEFNNILNDIKSLVKIQSSEDPVVIEEISKLQDSINKLKDLQMKIILLEDKI